MKQQIEKIDFVNINELKEHPKNPNKHSKEQIERLCKLIKYQGVRLPIIVSKLSGYIVAGHGRLEAFKKLNIEKVPVIYQDFDSEDQEYAFIVSDNAIHQDWAELDLSMINKELENIDGMNFDIENLGFKNYLIEPLEKIEPEIMDDIENKKNDWSLFIQELQKELKRLIDICDNKSIYNNNQKVISNIILNLIRNTQNEYFISEFKMNQEKQF